MTTSFLILHGIENHRPPEHWQFLLAAQLVERGYEVRYPALPEADAPELEQWLSTMQVELAALRGQQRVVVCHSLACLLWFHAAERGIGSPVDRLLLVSPPASEHVPDGGASFRLDTFDADAVRSSVNGDIAIVCSDADPTTRRARSPFTATRSMSAPRSSRAQGTSRPEPALARGPSRPSGAWPAGRQCALFSDRAPRRPRMAGFAPPTKPSKRKKEAR
jgi:predicted alpha/beta hydrolase family esterase